MTLSEFVQETFRAATGKLPTFAANSNKWNNIVSSANFYIRSWAREPGIDWNSLYDPAYSLGVITDTDTFDLDDNVRKISQQENDFVRIVHPSSVQYTDYDLVSADRLKSYASGNYVSQIGQSIRFNNAFTTSSPQYNGELFIPVYLYPDAVVRGTDVIPVNDPNWLILVVAADYVRNDITRKDLRADLISEANQAMERMRADNDAQISTVLTPWNPLTHVTDDISY